MHPDRVQARDRSRVRIGRTVYHQQWRDANRDAWNATMREAVRRRRTKLRGNDCRTVTERDLARMAVRQRGRCCYCDEPAELTVDHLIPISRGGRHSIGNIGLACFPCNRQKGAMTVIEFRRINPCATGS